MQNKLLLFLLFFSFSLFSQKVDLANSYFREGDYEKAISLYKPLHEQNPIRKDYFKKLLICYQEIEDFALADALLQNQLAQFPNQTYLNVEIGYNYQLQKDTEKAKNYYERALNYVRMNPNFGFVIGQAFKQNHLLDHALESYKIAKSANPKLNTEISEAQIYGEKGELNKMFNAYLDLINKNEKYYPSIQRYIATFISDDPYDTTNILFKKLLLKRAQSNPKDAWNILLSWLFTQQKDYAKAFVQEKSLYQRNQENVDRLKEIGIISFEKGDLETSKKVFQYILENSAYGNLGTTTALQAKIILLQIDNDLANDATDLKKVDEKFQYLLSEYGTNSSSLELQIAYANFLSYTYGQPEKAIQILNEALPLATTKLKKGALQINLADILVFTDQFNQALILYTQVQTELKNSPLAQEARFKVARTSYFKGNFQWAQTQLKVLKSSTSQLIANDALDLNLRITKNTANDTIQKALKIFAKAELLAFQNKYHQAIDTLNILLLDFKGHVIEDNALLKQAELYTVTKAYDRAAGNYIKILENFPESIFIDEACFQLAELYHYQLNDPQKAKEMYQKIIFEHPSSIYLVEARKKYRNLRGDELQ